MEILPFVDKENCFALIGGTAINLFIRDMPRLSVDLDFVYYLRAHERKEALKNIEASLRRIGMRVQKIFPSCRIQEGKRTKETDGTIGTIYQIHIRIGKDQVKLEVSPII